MKQLLILIVGISVFTSCQKDPEELEFRTKFHEKQTKITSTEVAETSGFNNSGRLYAGNAFTPNADGINDQYTIIFYFLDSSGTTSEPEYFKIYDCKKKLMRTLDNFSWDGANENGDIEEGEYGFEAALKLSTGETIIAHGYMLSIIDCLKKRYESDLLLFPSQIHPRLGFIFETQDVVSYCN